MRSVLALAALAAWSLAAVQPPATSGQTQPSPPADGSIVTVTGCLSNGETPGTFALGKVVWTPTATPAKSASAHHDSAPKGEPPKTPATATAAGSTPAAGDTLRLAGAAAKLKMDAHVGHTISVTGMLAPADPVVTPGVLLPDAPAGRAAGTRKNEPRVLNVRSFSHVAADCK